jgi:hypothetical protein
MKTRFALALSASFLLASAGDARAADPASSPVAIGKPVPDFSRKSIDGRPFSLSSARAITKESALAAVLEAAKAFGAADGKTKPEDAIDALPGVKDEKGTVDPEKRAQFLQQAARPAGLVARGKAVEGLKTLGDVAEWVAKSNEAPIVLMQWSSHCPTSKAYEERLVDLFSRTNARIYMLASNQSGETDEEVKAYVEDDAHPFQILLDRDLLVCDILGGKRTPHVFLLDAKNVLRYAGSIDDDPVEEKEASARAHWLEDAIVAVAENREVNVLMTSPKG